MALRCTTIRSPIGISGRGFVVALALCDLLLPINGLYNGLYHARPVQFMFVFDMTIVMLELKNSLLSNINGSASRASRALSLSPAKSFGPSRRA